MCRLDGHQGLDVVDNVKANLFDLLASSLLSAPKNIPEEFEHVFQDVDFICCKEKAELLLDIIHPQSNCCFRDKKTTESSSTQSVLCYNNL